VKYHFQNRPAVEADVINAVNYYKHISPKLAKQFLFRIREAKIYINRSPLAFEIKYKNVRTLLLKQFPFHIHYIIDEATKSIIITAVLHMSQNPDKWKGNR